MHFPTFSVPARLLEHPIETVVASLLLLALLFVSADPPGRAAAASATVSDNAPQKM